MCLASGALKENDIMSKLDGFTDEELHPNVHEALKVLVKAEDAYTKALENIEGQYLRSLDEAFAKQVNAVRRQMRRFSRSPWTSDGVKPRGFAKQ